MKELASKLFVSAALVAMCTSVAAAGTLPIVNGGLTFTGIVDTGFNFAGIDMRGTVAVGTPDGTALVTDVYPFISQAAFGNQTFAGTDPAPDGTGARVFFDLTTLLLAPGGSTLSVDSTGSTLVGPLSAAVTDLTSQILWGFALTNVVPNFDGNGNSLVTYSLTSAATPDAAPEPASIGLGSLGLLALAGGVARQRRITRGASLT